tara:strand:+ start:5938 stop:7035 length:1098 start_codon:yes stop_codon:yes gene_type:complete
MKICLIGNNLTSLILANILSKKNIYSEIYSLKSSRVKFQTRSLGITTSNLKYLNDFFKVISKKTKNINKIKVCIKNGKINDEILFSDESISLLNIIKYEDLFSIIKSKTAKCKHISFKNLKKKSDLIALTKEKKFQLVISCESYNILTKKFLKQEISKNYYNKAFTTVLRHSAVKNNVATQVFTEYGPIAYLPLSDKLTSVVFSYETNKKYIISENDIINLIKEHNPFYKILAQQKIEKFNLYLKLPKNYYYKNILFFGDAIHSIHPLAGQGFNMTIRDMIKFSELLDEKINLGLFINKSICKEFEKKTKNYNSLFSLGIDFIYEFFRFNKNFIPSSVSKIFFSYINKNQKIKDIGIKIANQGNL